MATRAIKHRALILAMIILSKQWVIFDISKS